MPGFQMKETATLGRPFQEIESYNPIVTAASLTALMLPFSTLSILLMAVRNRQAKRDEKVL